MNRHLFTEIKSKINDRSGYLLMNIVLLMLVLVLIASSLTFSALANDKGSNLSKNHNSVYYYAEGGLNEFGEKFQDYVASMEPLELSAFIDLSTQEISDKLEQDIVQWISTDTELMNLEASRIISLNPVSEEEIEVLSTASLGGVDRTVSQIISNIRNLDNLSTASGLCVSHAMMARDKLELLGGGDVKGSLKITHPVPGSLVVKNAGTVTIKDKVYFGKYENPNKIHEVLKPGWISWELFLTYIKGDPKYLIEDINEEFPVVVMPVIPSKETTTVLQKEDFIEGKSQDNGANLTIRFDESNTESFFADSTLNLKGLDSSIVNVSLYSLSQAGNKNWVDDFIIDVGDRNFNLVLDQLVLTSRLKVVGTGNLRIFVKDNSDVPSEFDPLKVHHEADKGYSKEKIAILLYNKSNKTRDIKLVSGLGVFAFSLIAENHNLNILDGARFTLHVMLLGEGNTLRTPSSSPGEYVGNWDLMFVPKGHISYGSSKFVGAMMGKTIEFRNTSADVTFTNKVDGLLPDEFDIFNPAGCNISGGSGEGSGGSGSGSGSGSNGELTLGPIREVKP